jgi:hypothetical protein
MDWIDQNWNRDRWLALVNAAIKLRVPYNAGNFLTSQGSVSCSRCTAPISYLVLWLVGWLDSRLVS